MFLVGLTGGIASGKSTVTKELQKAGIPVVDADVCAMQVVRPGTSTYKALRLEFGDEFFNAETGFLDRKALGNVVFKDSEKRKRLNAITHPAIRWEMLAAVLSYLFHGCPFVVLDVPLLFNGKLYLFMQKIIVVTCLPVICSVWMSPKPIKAVEALKERCMVKVTWCDDSEGLFPYVWLRDNCPAPHTYLLTDRCKARTMVMSDLDPEVEPVRLCLTNNSMDMFIEWPEELTATYSSKWLEDRNLANENIQRKRAEVMLLERELWSGNIFREKLMKFWDFPTLLTDDRAFHDCLTDLCRYGLVFMRNSSCNEETLKQLSRRVGLNYKTHYGEYFSVKTSSDPSNVAYTSGPIGFHTDLPYLIYPPQTQVLHVIQQTVEDGGDNEFADSFHVAKEIQTENASAYNLLSTVELEYVDDGVDEFRFDLVNKRKVFNFDEHGALKEVHFSNQQRSWFYNIPVDDIQSMYRAMNIFNKCMDKPENKFTIKLQNGEMAWFDNLRVLHNRRGFKIGNVDGTCRHLRGCYFNWDVIRSRIRVLRDTLGLLPNQVSV